MNPIHGIPLPPSIGEGLPELEKLVQSPDAQTSFKEFLLESLDHVNSMQHQADNAVESLVTGGDVNPAEVLTAVQKADLSFRMMMQIRNKLVQAYQEVKEIRI